MRNDELIEFYLQEFNYPSNPCNGLAKKMIREFLEDRMKQPISDLKVPTKKLIEKLGKPGYTRLIHDRKYQFDTHILLNAMYDGDGVSDKGSQGFLRAYCVCMPTIRKNTFPEDLTEKAGILISEFETQRSRMISGHSPNHARFQLAFDQFIRALEEWSEKDHDKVLQDAFTELRAQYQGTGNPNRNVPMMRLYISKMQGGPEALAALDRELQAQQPA
jgi:hypothetical protein